LYCRLCVWLLLKTSGYLVHSCTFPKHLVKNKNLLIEWVVRLKSKGISPPFLRLNVPEGGYSVRITYILWFFSSFESFEANWKSHNACRGCLKYIFQRPHSPNPFLSRSIPFIVFLPHISLLPLSRCLSFNFSSLVINS